MNKFSFLIDNECNLYEDIKKVEFSINSYLKPYCQCDQLIWNIDALIFGGAVRDSLANMSIHDVDILVLPKAFKIIQKKLTLLSFREERRYNHDICSLYDASIINEPVSFYKDNIIIQLIRPVLSHKSQTISIDNLLYCAEQVDLTCCGVSYSPGKLTQHCENAIEHCKNKVFKELPNHNFYNAKRIQHRIAKLEDRGWREIDNQNKCLRP